MRCPEALNTIKTLFKGGKKMKKLILLVICFMFVGVGSIFAQTEKSPLLGKSAYEVGLEVSYLTYKEPNLKTQGMMYGLVGSYTYHNKIMLKAELRGSYGGVKWDGLTLEGRVTENNCPNFLLEFRGLGGYDFPISTSSILTPYVGIGVRYLNNDVLPRPYERESNYIYTPIGIGLITDLGKGWSVGGAGEYDYFWWGYQTSHPMDSLPGLDHDIESNQRDGYGLRGSITFEKKYKKVAFEGGPFITYWNIKKLKPEILPYTVNGSTTGFVWQEPGNHSLQVGIKLGVKF
jgi:hypothetical protein